MSSVIQQLGEVHDCLVRAQFLLNQLFLEGVHVQVTILDIFKDQEQHTANYLIMESKLATERKLKEYGNDPGN